MSSSTSLVPPSLFNLHTGKITPAFQRQLNLCGIQLREHVSGLGRDHIVNVNREFQSNGCFQSDCDFYKNGNNSKLSLSYEQAVAFLDDDYRDRTEVLPRSTGTCDAIVGSGVEATMHKRFDSIRKAIQHGCKFDTIHFIAKDEATQHMIEGLIKERYGEVVDGSKINYIVTNVNIGILETGLTSLNQQGTLADKYVLVTDIPFASKIEGIAKPILRGKTCIGVSATSINDWHVDMNLYGYEDALGGKEKATVAWACSALNFKARQVRSELAEYEANKRERDKKNVQTAVLAFGGAVCLAILANFVFKKFQSAA